MSTTQFGGPGSAFAFAAPTRPARRTNSSSSFKDGATAPPPATSPGSNGPAPVQPPTQPSLGSFAPLSEREGATMPNGNHSSSDGGSPGGHGPASAAAPGRSFSSILSPSLAATANGGQLGDAQGVNGRGKPFVYTRDFLLSLYDEDKARQRPLELAIHDTATRDLYGADSHKPWLLKEYRDGEKELFATSIHPANTRPSRMSRNDSTLSANGGAGATLDLSSLGTLPRDRDRALGSPSLRSPSIDKDGILGSAARDRRTRERSLGGTMGIVGGVLGGIANGAPTSRRRDESVGSAASKDTAPWQSGRWRRSAQETEEGEAQSPSVTSRRFPGELSRQSSISEAAGKSAAPASSWEQASVPRETGTEKDASAGTDAIPSEPEIAASLLGSLALDSEPVDDPLLSRNVTSATPSGAATPSSVGPPPGLAPAVPPAEVMWQYRDPSGQVQGPFSAVMMHDWYRQQFFSSDLRVKRSTDADFESLEILIRRVGDSEQPFLAPKPAAVSSAFSSAPGTPQPGSAWGSGASTARAQTPLEQLTAAVAQGRFGASGGAAASSPFYEPFGSAAGSPSVSGQALPQNFGRSPLVQGAVDPWGATLVGAGGSPWTGLGAGQQQHPQLQQHQQVQSPAQQQPMFAQQPAAGMHSPMDLLRQLAAQQHGLPSPQQAFAQQPQQQQQQQQQHMPAYDAFGRPAPVPSTNFLDPNQLASPGQHPGAPAAWHGQQLQQSIPQQPQQAQPQQPSQQQQQQQQFQDVSQPWAAPSPAPLAQNIAPPSPVKQSQPEPEQQAALTAQAASSPWNDVKVESQERTNEPTPAQASKPQPAEAKWTPSTAKQAQVDAEPRSDDQLAAEQAAAPKATSPAPAPWAKEEKKVVKPVAAAPSPSLREIQEAEAREAEKRKEIARAQAAQAAVEAAQRQAALDAQEAAESLPSSASWAAGPAQVPATKSSTGPAPWLKPAAAPAPVVKGQKTLKEIQEEEERQKKAAQAAREQQQAAVGLTGSRGYAGATSTATAGGSPWTTVATRPQVARAPASTAKPVIPGLPSTAAAGPSRSVSSATAPSKAATPAAVRPPAPPVPAVRPTAPRSVNVGASSPNTTVYDMENPPPPSAEFLAWTKQALKGLNVPLEEFVQMLLSFPLDASADVLEIISDSVYANSSTLDGRRFANDFATRRRNDVAVRYPSIFAKGAVRTAAVKPSSMASVLASANSQPKQSEWNVKVSTKKKSKGGK